MKNTVTVFENAEYFRLPDYAEKRQIKGLTLRRALKELRFMTWGNIGEMRQCELSDGTFLSVELESTSNFSNQIMNSQKIVRRAGKNSIDRNKVIRKYKI